ncbi:MAG: DUF2520 domain-containing protein [Desulfuromonadales bacterium]|nr:DUF2520 domain-containing protein [Desulfuromonadales bacterium]
MKPRIVLIGPGRVGAAVAKRLHRAGYPLEALISRDRIRAEEAAQFIGCDPDVATSDLARVRAGEIILMSIPDDQIEPMAKHLQETIGLAKKTTLVHFSGLKQASCMFLQGYETGLLSIHPLLSFADREMAAERLTGCPCALEGDAALLPLAEELATAMGGCPFPLPSEAKTIYHAAACVTSNYLVTLSARARDLLSYCGFDEHQAMELLRPLLRATCDNLDRLPPEKALTGPIVRGDTGTVTKHLTAMLSSTPEFLDLYCCMGEQTIDLATASGRLNKDQALKLKQLFTRYSENHQSGHQEEDPTDESSGHPSAAK